MTREEAKKMLTNTKVYVNGRSKEIQEKLFEIGFRWGSYSGKNVHYLDAPFLFITHVISYSYNMQTFSNYVDREVSADDILNIKIDEEFVPKHGDIISVKSNGYNYIEIFDKFEDKKLWCSYYICVNFPTATYRRGFLSLGEIYVISIATKEEKDMLFRYLKEKGYVWNEKTKEVETIKKQKKEHEFKPFDKVLVRDFGEDNWDIDFFQEIGGEDIDYKYICLSNGWNFCIPYEGNEHLLGTSNSPK